MAFRARENAGRKNPPPNAPHPRIASLIKVFGRVGVTVFGGGDPATAILQQEFDQRGWLNAEKFGVAFGLARLTPGTNVLAFCAAAGYYILGLPGAVVAVLAITIPPSILVVWITRAYDLAPRYPIAQAVANALVAAAVGTMIGAALLLVRNQCSRGKWLRPIVIAAGAFVLSDFAKFSPLEVIAVAAVAGFFWVES